MKKTLLLLCALLTFIGGAWAQLTSISDGTLVSLSFQRVDNNVNGWIGSDYKNNGATAATAAVLKFEATDAAGTYYIKNVASGKYLYATSTTTSGSSTDTRLAESQSLPSSSSSGNQVENIDAYKWVVTFSSTVPNKTYGSNVWDIAPFQNSDLRLALWSQTPGSNNNIIFLNSGYNISYFRFYKPTVGALIAANLTFAEIKSQGYTADDIAALYTPANLDVIGWPSTAAFNSLKSAIDALDDNDVVSSSISSLISNMWTNVVYPSTGFYYFHNVGSGRYAFSDEGLDANRDYLNDETRTAKYIWHVTLTGDNKVQLRSLTGKGMVSDKGEHVNNMSLATAFSNGVTSAYGAFYVGEDTYKYLQDPMQAGFTFKGGSNTYESSTNPMKVAGYAYDSNNAKAYWKFESVDMSAFDVYSVSIVGAPSNNYVQYTGDATTGNKKVYNGGWYLMTKDASVSINDFTPEAVANYDVAVSISDKVITVTYTVASYITYRLTDKNGATYEATIPGETGVEQELNGCYGYTLSNKSWSGSTFTADIDFGFPVSSNSVNNATAIQSALGTSLWYAKDGKVIADNSANTPNPIYNTFADNYRWYIYPVFDNGTFSFKLYNVGAAKYIPSNPSTGSNTATTLTADAASAGAFQFAHYSQGNGFYDTATSKFLTINSSGAAQNIWLWGGYGSGTHQGSVMSFPALTVVSVSDAFAALKNATKFDILEGSAVVGPSEFAAPAEINAAIDAAQNVADNDEAKLAFIQGSNGAMIKNYLNMVESFGALATIKITMSKEYGTMILPCPATRISGLDIYACSAQENGVLTLTPVDGNYSYNVPYIIHAAEGSKYTIIGWNKGSTATHTEGWLTGVLNSDTDIPSGSYMLATKKDTGVQAFYQVEGAGVKCAINKCYLTVPSSSSVKAFFFEDSGLVDAIESLFDGQSEQGPIYNLAGQRLNKLQRGVNIINGKKVLVK